MAAWVSVAEALAALRRFVNDGPTDRPIKNKAVTGVVDGANTVFLTYEDRLVADTLVVTVNEATVPAVVGDLVRGEFTLATPPAAGDRVRAHYYFQYFLDEDLTDALGLAAGEIIEADGSADITGIVPGLKASALLFAKSFAFGKQAIRWAERMSERFLLEDAPIDSDPRSRANLFEEIAKTALRQAIELRTSYYTGHGRRNIPAYAITKPRIATIGPRR